MHSLGLGVAAALLVGGCARSTLALLVPKLELRCALHHLAADDAAAGRSERWGASASALLRWRPTIEAREVPSPYELIPAAWVAPCGDSDIECLREVAEAEVEVATAIRQEP
jgi:hypothetical protein